MSVRSIQRATLVALIFAAVPVSAASAPPRADTTELGHALASRDSVTIVITDSGLGGMSVVADAVTKLQGHPAYGHIDLIFANALFTAEGGYNSLTDREQKIRIFGRALEGMQARLKPDVVLIACNTLSVLYQDTEFASTTDIPVFGIIEDGVNLIADNMTDDGAARTILFATETTVEEGSHKAGLIEQGLAPESIVTQACPELASYIEQGFDGMETEFLIDAYVGEALGKIGAQADPLFVSFNCTHYGYALEGWRAAFASRGVEVAGFLNPNTKMIDVLLSDDLVGRRSPATMTVRAVSMVEIPQAAILSIGRFLHAICPEAEAALTDYELIPDLFKWNDIAK